MPVLQGGGRLRPPIPTAAVHCEENGGRVWGGVWGEERKVVGRKGKEREMEKGLSDVDMEKTEVREKIFLHVFDFYGSKAT